MSPDHDPSRAAQDQLGIDLTEAAVRLAAEERATRNHERVNAALAAGIVASAAYLTYRVARELMQEK